jgi:glycosyltransferase involved in cell wall biosynthesis
MNFISRPISQVKTYKIYVPAVPINLMLGELQNIIVAGVKRNQKTSLCDDIDESDYIFLDFRHLQNNLYSITHPEKTIIIDYRDNQYPLFPNPSLLYFKRSVVDRGDGEFCRYDREVRPIGYCVKDAYLALNSRFNKVRDIDVAVFFNCNENPDTARNYYRSAVTQFVKTNFNDLSTFIGIAGNDGEPGRSGFQEAYFSIMSRAKIVVTCNPDRWEGDYRLFEALSSGSLVMSDKMKTPMMNPFIHNKHLIYYDKTNLDTLADQIRRLLIDEEKRLEIANNGYRHAMSFHTTEKRIDEILAQVELSKKIKLMTQRSRISD